MFYIVSNVLTYNIQNRSERWDEPMRYYYGANDNGGLIFTKIRNSSVMHPVKVHRTFRESRNFNFVGNLDWAKNVQAISIRAELDNTIEIYEFRDAWIYPEFIQALVELDKI